MSVNIEKMCAGGFFGVVLSNSGLFNPTTTTKLIHQCKPLIRHQLYRVITAAIKTVPAYVPAMFKNHDR